MTQTLPETPPRAGARFHRAWIVAAVTLVALVGAAGFRARTATEQLPRPDGQGAAK